MAELDCYIATFNCGRTPVDVDFFAASFFDGVTTNLPPDLIVLCLEEVAPICYSFLGGSFLNNYFTPLTTAIHVATARRFERENEYTPILVRNVGMTALMIFARHNLEERIRRIETAGVGVGWWEMGNKGAVGARLALMSDGPGEEVALTLVAAHLAPMEEAWERRNEDWKNICQGLVFQREKRQTREKSRGEGGETEPLFSTNNQDMRDNDNGGSTLFTPITHILFAGDLNYRTSDKAPGLDDPTSWPQPVDSIEDIHHYSHLLPHDQLNREKAKGNTLHNLSEAEIAFPPTYKYSSVAQKQATRASLKQEVNQDQSWLWAKHRFPSWCDRILFLGAEPPKVHAYTALPVQPTSDHRPVVLSCSIPLKAVSGQAQNVQPPFPIRKDWREARAAARRYEVVVGFAAYLALTWEGEALLGGTVIGVVGGFLALRALLGA